MNTQITHTTIGMFYPVERFAFVGGFVDIATPVRKGDAYEVYGFACDPAGLHRQHNVEITAHCTDMKQAYKVAHSFIRQLEDYIQDCHDGLKPWEYQIIDGEPHGSKLVSLSFDEEVASWVNNEA